MRPKIGLVLGGGGIRGLAHIGVLEILEREHIPIDYIVGTSMGAIVGAAFALGSSSQQIAGYMERVGSSNLLGGLNMFSSRSRQKAIEEHLRLAMGHQTFADLHIPMTVMAVDMQTGEEVQLTQGELVPAILASAAVPAVFPPVEINGRQLADGGVIDSLATQPAYAMGADRVIAVDVYPALEMENIWKDPISAVMGFQIPFNLLGNDRNPGVVSSLWRSFRIMVWYTHQMRLQQCKPDLLLRPPVDSYGSLDFKDTKGPIEAGRKTAEAHLDEIKALLVGGARAEDQAHPR
jgi:NTE family protein